jgi:hypothetical protein
MTMAVKRDLMSGSDDLGGEGRIAFHLLAGEEERRGHAEVGQSVKDRGRPLGVRAVIEGERDARLGDEARVDRQTAGDRGRDWGKRRERVDGEPRPRQGSEEHERMMAAECG